jgi:Secretion system C-terminal sorting domain
MRTIIPTFLFVILNGLIFAQYTPNVSIEQRGIMWPAGSAAQNCSGSNPTVCPTFNIAGMNWYMSGTSAFPFSFVYSSLGWTPFNIANRDYAMVYNGVIETRDPNGEICFNSPVLNITGLGTVNMTFVVNRLGLASDPWDQYVRFEYKVNGGATVSSGNLTGGFGVTSSWSPTASGATLELRACLRSTGNNEVYNLTSMNTNVGAPLPVKWSGIFLSPTEKGQSQLYWQTASEINNDYFDIERSMDGLTFSTIGRVKGSGNRSEATNYEYLDETAKAGNTYYYRIKQVDLDGIEDFSTVLSIYIKGLSLGIKLSPNPADDEVKIELDQPIETPIILEVFALNGSIIKTMTIDQGQYFKDLDLSTFPDGLYLLKSKGSEHIYQKFIKKSQ